MTLSQFVNTNYGKRLDWDGSFGAQCVDVVSFWTQNLNLPHIQGNANRLRYNADPASYQWVGNGLRKPMPGDIVIFNLGRYGHVGICYEANALGVKTFEQNNPIGSACRLVNHPLYYRVVGWLHPKILGQGGIVTDDEFREVAWHLVNGFYLNYYRRQGSAQEIEGHVNAIAQYEPRKWALSEWVNKQKAESEFLQYWTPK